MDELIQAIGAGDYRRAYEALRGTPEADTVVGIATGGFLLALVGRYDEAERQLAKAGAVAYEAIVRGEREREARCKDVRAAGALSAAGTLTFPALYASMAVALVERDESLANDVKRDLETIAPVAGQLRFRDGHTRGFSNIVDSDDAIGQMLETYTSQGLLYVPFAGLRRIEFLPQRSFVDRLMPKATLVDAQGQTSTVFVPFLYAGSTTANEPSIRTGQTTSWDYVGDARRGRGQRDFVLDGGVLVGMQNVAAIELAGRAAA